MLGGLCRANLGGNVSFCHYRQLAWPPGNGQYCDILCYSAFYIYLGLDGQREAESHPENPVRSFMEQDHSKAIEEIISHLKCPKDFICKKSGFKVLCKARDIGIQSFLLCLEEDPPKCKFSLALEREYICECPVRIYVAKKLGK